MTLSSGEQHCAALASRRRKHYLRSRSAVYGRLSAGNRFAWSADAPSSTCTAPEILTVDSDDTRALPTSDTHLCQAPERPGREMRSVG